jgi:hypothetical protein
LDIGPLVAKNFAQLPRVDYLEGFNCREVEGREIDNPGLEAYAQIRAIQAMRDGISRAGKPGLAIALYPIHTRTSTLVAPIGHEFGLRNTDGVMLSPLPDFKIESGYITTALIYSQHGMNLIVDGSTGLCAGTYVGSPENAIIEDISKTIISWICYKATIHGTAVQHTSEMGGEMPVLDDVSWAWSVATQALSRHTNFITFNPSTFTNEIGTADSLKEIAITVIRGTVSGGNIWISKVHPAVINRGQTPLEMKFSIELSDAVINANIQRNDVIKLVGDWMKELHRKKIKPKKGTTITDIYDLTKGEPREPYFEVYDSIKNELRRRGLPL